MREDIRSLVAKLLDDTGADEAVVLGEDADAHLGREAARKGGVAEFDYHLLTHKLPSAKARGAAIVEVAGQRRTTGRKVGDPGPSPVGPLHTR